MAVLRPAPDSREESMTSLPRSQLHLAPWPVLDSDRRAGERERLADLVFQKAFVREVQLHVFVGEQYESRRRDGSLGHVKHMDFLAVGNSGTLEVHGFEETVHL